VHVQAPTADLRNVSVEIRCSLVRGGMHVAPATRARPDALAARADASRDNRPVLDAAKQCGREVASAARR
jgi:hypothetical protein